MTSTLPDPFDFAAAMFDPPPPYNSDPALWASEILDEFFWSAQTEIANSIVTERYTAVQSCHDGGKSYVASRIAAWWIATHPLGEAFIVSTAPTTAQISAILWREIIRAHKKADLPGSIVSAGYPQWKISGGELVGYGRKPADYSDAAFQGIHARFPLIILDEAGGIDESLYNAVDSLATNTNARVLAIGNPDDPASHFATVCKPNSGWNVLRIDGLATPNFTREAVEWVDCRQCRVEGATEPLLARLFREEGIPYSTEEVPESLRDLLLSPLWVEERLHRWVGSVSPTDSVSEKAAASPLFVSKVRGLFPDSSSEGVIPLGWVERAMDRGREFASNPLSAHRGRKILGADIASTGSDQTAIAIRHGQIITEVRKYQHADTMETVSILEALLNEPKSIAVVDAIGIGAGVVDRIRQLELPVRAFTASHGTDSKDRSGEFGFINLRAAAWWNLRELLDPSRGATLALPDSEILKADLTSPRYSVLQGGRIKVEAKDDIRKRLGRSTDDGDAVVMAAWLDATTPTSDSQDGGGDVLPWFAPDEFDQDALSWGVGAGGW